jgi:hypothetical protein
VLADQLYFGPWSERYGVAEMLATIEPAGIEVLEAAAKCDDPWIKRPADYAVSVTGRLKTGQRGARQNRPTTSELLYRIVPLHFKSRPAPTPQHSGRGWGFPRPLLEGR